MTIHVFPCPDKQAAYMPTAAFTDWRVRPQDLRILGILSTCSWDQDAALTYLIENDYEFTPLAAQTIMDRLVALGYAPARAHE